MNGREPELIASEAAARQSGSRIVESVEKHGQTKKRHKCAGNRMKDCNRTTEVASCSNHAYDTERITNFIDSMINSV